jgi:hypothetical protein
MNRPKLHHYVPQFHLARFADSQGKLWVWDRKLDRVFPTLPKSMAAETQFYRLTQYEAQGHDGATMEKQFSELESNIAQITVQWLDWLRAISPREMIQIPGPNRGLVSLHLALQYLRTSDTREILSALLGITDGKEPSPEECRRVHTNVLWDEKLVSELAARFERSVWVFARNETATPFITSDNPIAFRTGDSRRWLRAGIISPGTYAVYPLAPDIVMYCHPHEAPWHDKLDQFADCLSPIALNEEMVRSENSGQVFMASRFVLSSRDSFAWEREFAATIGTDVYNESKALPI